MMTSARPVAATSSATSGSTSAAPMCAERAVRAEADAPAGSAATRPAPPQRAVSSSAATIITGSNRVNDVGVVLPGDRSVEDLSVENLCTRAT